MATGTDRLPNHEQMERLISATAGNGGGGGGGTNGGVQPIFNGLSSAVTNLHNYFVGYNFTTTATRMLAPWGSEHAISIADYVSDTSGMFRDSVNFDKAVYIGNGVTNTSRMFDNAGSFNRPVYMGFSVYDGRSYDLTHMFANLPHWNKPIDFLHDNLPLTVNVTGILFNTTYAYPLSYNMGMTNWYGAYAQQGRTDAVVVGENAIDCSWMLYNARNFNNTVTFLGNNVTTLSNMFTSASVMNTEVNIPESVVNMEYTWSKSFIRNGEINFSTHDNLVYANGMFFGLQTTAIMNNVFIGNVYAADIFRKEGAGGIIGGNAVFRDTKTMYNAFRSVSIPVANLTVNTLPNITLEGNIPNTSNAFANGSPRFNMFIGANIDDASNMFVGSQYQYANISYGDDINVVNCHRMFAGSPEQYNAVLQIPPGAVDVSYMYAFCNNLCRGIGNSQFALIFPNTVTNMSSMFYNSYGGNLYAKFSTITFSPNTVNMYNWKQSASMEAYGSITGQGAVYINMPYLVNGVEAFQQMPNLTVTSGMNIGTLADSGNYTNMFMFCNNISPMNVNIGNNANCANMFRYSTNISANFRIGENAFLAGMFAGSYNSSSGVGSTPKLYVKPTTRSLQGMFTNQNRAPKYVYTDAVTVEHFKTSFLIEGVQTALTWEPTTGGVFNRAYGVYLYANYT